ncbi:hypothetical protein K466DRAFT_490528 [Polyporus arcularius HHB13444]|uniref:BTB domain-containing protein n=1 Tax=Polyporus arcularius HHB13444 TaxID=1314778 RepID=A0A5C3PG72_9APHY|nr:hypothetical protein K466DRAFT_490528 [Polyporus arcularius HHB13444]
MSESHDPTRDTDLWLEDGNVVIVAQDTAFRVHRGLLSRHSEVFGGLFALAQPDAQDAVELCGGCPVVRIPDSSHDFRHLLHALYDGLSALEFVEESTKFSMYAALARLGDKYGLPHIFTAAIKWLSIIFTDTYTAWHDLWTEHGNTIQIMIDRGVNPFEAANLFRITGQERMRPTALFMCSQLDVPVLLEGLPRADGLVEVLSRDDLQRCLEARIRFTAEMTTFLHVFYFVNTARSATSCPRLGSCALAFAPEREAHRSYTLGANKSYYQNPFKISISMCWKITEDKCLSGALCELCASHLLEIARDLAKSHWDALPGIMGLEDCNYSWEKAPVGVS